MLVESTEINRAAASETGRGRWPAQRRTTCRMSHRSANADDAPKRTGRHQMWIVDRAREAPVGNGQKMPSGVRWWLFHGRPGRPATRAVLTQHGPQLLRDDISSQCESI